MRSEALVVSSKRRDASLVPTLHLADFRMEHPGSGVELRSPERASSDDMLAV